MKATELKKLIKEAVKEAIGEEMREILLEAVRAPRQVVSENQTNFTPTPTEAAPRVDIQETRTKYADVLNGMSKGEDRNISMNSSHAPNYAPQASNTSAQGSSLPPGEVNMEQIMGFIGAK